jgi:hypothetical protein
MVAVVAFVTEAAHTDELHVRVAPLLDEAAGATAETRRILPLAIQGLGKTAGNGRLAYLGRTCEEIGVGEAAFAQAARQSAYDPLLPDDAPRGVH